MQMQGNEENEWSTMLSNMSSSPAQEQRQQLQSPETTRTRGLTSALSGRRQQRQESGAVVNDFIDNALDDDEAPPDSLLVEVPAEPLGENDNQNNSNGPGFVQRATQAVNTRIRDLGLRPTGDMPLPPPPPHRHSSTSNRAQSQQQQQQQQPQHSSQQRIQRRHRRRRASGSSSNSLDDLSYRERALRAWRDSHHQDAFFCRVYEYYVGRGATAIVVGRALQLATMAVVVVVSTFVFGCIDHAKVREQKSLAAMVDPQCVAHLPGTAKAGLLALGIFWATQIVRTALDVPGLLEIRAFFTEVLAIASADVGTVAWNEVVRRMVALRDTEISRYRGSAHSRVLEHRLGADVIMNRIMRRENYMVAMFNRDLLDMSVPILRREHMLTTALQWNLSFCLLSYVFDENGQLRRRFLRESNRAVLAEGLRRRFQFMAVVNLMLVPFLIIFLSLYAFLRYFEELYRDPGTLASRSFTRYAKYKFRNFNEVPHAFRRRIAAAKPKATLYMAQFRNYALISAAKFIAFIAGAFAALLLLFTVVDNELSLEFEITPHRTVLFYIGLSSAVLAGARAMVPTDEHEYLHPAWIIRDALEDLQYIQPEWRGHLDSIRVRRDFEVLFTYKPLIFLYEMLGVVTAPLIMFFSLPRCAGDVVDFFREFTTRVDGLGYVCSFATFNFEAHGNARFAAPTTGTAMPDRRTTRNGKMEQSFLAFKANYPEWNPREQAASTYLQRAQAAQQEIMRTSGIAGGWQARLLHQQRMAGSVYPTGASLFKERQPQPANAAQRKTPGPSATAAAAATTVRSQYAFQPLQTLNSQSNLPFGPTLGVPAIAEETTTASNDNNVVGEEGPVTDRLALSSLPLVASPDIMGDSLEMTAANGSRLPQQHAGVFSILNQLYEQQIPHHHL